MKHQKHPPTYISVGDFHISAEELQNIAPVEVMLLSLIGRSLNAKIKRLPEMRNWAGDLAVHMYHTIRKQQDFSPRLQECDIQQKVSSLLNNSMRDSAHTFRNAAYAPLYCKGGYLDVERRVDADDDKRDTAQAYIDQSAGNDPVEMVALRDELRLLRRAINLLPKQQRMCASLLYKGMGVNEIGTALGIQKSRAYNLIHQSTKALQKLIMQQLR